MIELKEKYNAGKISLEEARKLLKERVKTLTPYEIAYAEQKIVPFVEDECIKENIQNMMLLFNEVMDTSRPTDLPSDHPIMCYYRENDDMRELLKEVENLIQFPVIKINGTNYMINLIYGGNFIYLENKINFIHF